MHCSGLTTSATYNVLIFMVCLRFCVCVAALVHIPPDRTGWFSVYMCRIITYATYNVLMFMACLHICLSVAIMVHILPDHVSPSLLCFHVHLFCPD